MQGCEAALADHLAAVLDAGGTPDLDTARTAVVPPVITAPAVLVMAPDLAGYDLLRTDLGKPHDRRRRRQAAGDADRVRLPTISRIWQEFGARADREGWGSARFLAAICDHELAERAARRIARHMAESGLPHGKTFATLDFAAVPTIRKAHVMALAEGDAWIEQGGNP